jgi:hypothetical protein
LFIQGLTTVATDPTLPADIFQEDARQTSFEFTFQSLNFFSKMKNANEVSGST